MNTEGERPPEELLNRLLGSYRAEWLDTQLYDLFTAPTYFGQLTTSRPCILLGGRGTGKTTVLKGLSYQGQFELKSRDFKKLRAVPFIGLYYRVNTNRTTAFRGPELSEERWTSYFAHYLNLVFCQLVLDYVEWHQDHSPAEIALSESTLSSIATSLTIAPVTTVSDLAAAVDAALVEFEAIINSVGDNTPVRLSMQGAPLDLLTSSLLKTPALSGKQFYFLIDEYENFLDYQQLVLNTIIKHSSAPYTFKIGIKELGWRQRSTLTTHERLTHPADYERIQISQKLSGAKFKSFAASVVETRLLLAYPHLTKEDLRMSVLFPDLSEMEEADLLLDSTQINSILDQIQAAGTKKEFTYAKKLKKGELYFLSYWASADGHDDLITCLRDHMSDKKKWNGRMTNHFYASLFAIKEGKRGIRKYYSGWDTLVALANGNIRYLLELVHTAFLRHLDQKHKLLEPISPETQTLATQEVGGKNLAELDGLSVEGARLTKLVLSLGRIFQLLASAPAGHAPETNQFTVRRTFSTSTSEDRVQRILNEAVMHQALVRFAGSKLMDEADTRDFDYTLHPLFAPFFVFSHRRKRKLTLEDADVVNLVENHREAIKKILSNSNRSEAEQLPDQLQLFGAFYESR